MEALKNYILDFYKTHGKYISICFYDVMDDLKIPKDELDVMLRNLIQDGFIYSVQDADDVAYEFCLKQ
jgi:hypothetical protein